MIISRSSSAFDGHPLRFLIFYAIFPFFHTATSIPAAVDSQVTFSVVCLDFLLPSQAAQAHDQAVAVLCNSGHGENIRVCMG